MRSHVLPKTTSQTKYKSKRMDDEISSARLAVPWYTASVVKKYEDGTRMTTADKGLFVPRSLYQMPPQLRVSLMDSTCVNTSMILHHLASWSRMYNRCVPIGTSHFYSPNRYSRRVRSHAISRSF